MCVYIYIKLEHIREPLQKCFVMLSKFWPLKGLEDLGESVKKRKFVIKIFLRIVLNEVLKSCKIDLLM